MNKFVFVALFLLTVSYVHARKQNKTEPLDAGDCSSVPNCAKCSRNDTCIRCVNGTFAVPNRPGTCDGVKPKRNVSCVEKCPVGTEPRHTRRRGPFCGKIDCSSVPNCAVCSSNDTCIRCENGSFTVPTDSSGKRRKDISCVDACPEGTEPLQKPCGLSICVKTDCASNCAECKNGKCVKCADGSFTVINGPRPRKSNILTCEAECPEGTKQFDCIQSGDKFCVKAGSGRSPCRKEPKKPCPDESDIEKSCPGKPQGKLPHGGKPQGVKPPRDA